MQIEEKEYDQSFDWRIWKKLFPFMKPFRKYMIIALVFNTLCALVDIALPLFQQYAIIILSAEIRQKELEALQELI